MRRHLLDRAPKAKATGDYQPVAAGLECTVLHEPTPARVVTANHLCHLVAKHMVRVGGFKREK